jgi:hypothetical protein
MDHSIRYPDGSTRDRNGVFVLPGGALLTETDCQGEIRLPDGSVLLDSGCFRYPSGVQSTPDGRLLSVGGDSVVDAPWVLPPPQCLDTNPLFVSRAVRLRSVLDELKSAKLEAAELWDALEDKESESELLTVRSSANVARSKVEQLTSDLRDTEAQLEELGLVLVEAGASSEHKETALESKDEQIDILKSELATAQAHLEELSLAMLMGGADSPSESEPRPPEETQQLNASVRFPNLTLKQWGQNRAEYDNAFVSGLSKSLSLPLDAFGPVTTTAGSVIAAVEVTSPLSAPEVVKSLESLSFEHVLEHEDFDAPVVDVVQLQDDLDDSSESRDDADDLRAELDRLQDLLVLKSLAPFSYFYRVSWFAVWSRHNCVS